MQELQVGMYRTRKNNVESDVQRISLAESFRHLGIDNPDQHVDVFQKTQPETAGIRIKPH